MKIKKQKKNPKCKVCWDKGYFTELIGGTRSATDFGKLEYHESGMQMRKNFCQFCAKGRKLKATADKQEEKASAPKEKEIQDAILELLAWHKIFVWRNNSGCVFSKYKGKERMIRIGAKGSPDIIGIFKGRFLGIEVKASWGKIRPEQSEFLEKIGKSGGIGFVARSVEDVENKLGLI